MLCVYIFHLPVKQWKTQRRKRRQSLSRYDKTIPLNTKKAQVHRNSKIRSSIVIQLTVCLISHKFGTYITAPPIRIRIAYVIVTVNKHIVRAVENSPNEC